MSKLPRVFLFFYTRRHKKTCTPSPKRLYQPYLYLPFNNSRSKQQIHILANYKDATIEKTSKIPERDIWETLRMAK